jgi:hypothetical protein
MKYGPMRCTRWNLPCQSRLIGVAAAMLFFVLSAQAQTPPYITATQMTVQAGQTQGKTVIQWDAGPAYDDAEVWQQTDGGKETKFSGAPSGSRTITIELNKKYTFNIYRDTKADKPLVSVDVTANSPSPGTPPVTPSGGTPLDDLAAKGKRIAKADPLSAELRKREPEGPSQRGFDIGMAAAEGHTAPGPGKQRIHDSLSLAEQRGFERAVSFSLERNKNADFAARGARIAKLDPKVADARIAETDVFYWLGFDIATGIFGDPALGALGNTATGPGSLKIRDSLSPAGQRGFNASVKLLVQPTTAATVPGKPVAYDPNAAVTPIGRDDVKTGTVEAIKAMRPFIDNVQVRPDTRDVLISFTSTQQSKPLIEIGKAQPQPDRFGILAFGFNSGAFSRFVPGENGEYLLNLGTLNEQLDIGTTYYYIINVYNDNKNDNKRPREQVTGKFTTLPQTVKVVWDKVTIEDDSDDLSPGEISFLFWANYKQPSAKRSRDYFGRLDSDHDYYPGLEIVVENAPDRLFLAWKGQDDDDDFVEYNKVFVREPCKGPGTEFGSMFTVNCANGEFDLSQYPGNNVNVPFRLNSMPHGDLRFAIFGHLEITRPRP